MDRAAMNGQHSLGYRIKNVLRVIYTLPFVLASITGVAFALTLDQQWLIAVLIPLDVFCLALFVNLSNDYYDHKSGSDRERFEMIDQSFAEEASYKVSKAIYWQGNSFDRGLITERGGKVLLACIACVALLLAIPILLFGGWIVLLLGAIAFFLSFFYTAPPLNLGARGLGELDVLLSFAMMSFFSFYVIVQQFNLEALIIALTVGMNVMMMRIIDEMSGLEAHKKAEEKDLVVRFGIKTATNIIIGILVAMYALCAVLVTYNLTFLLLFLTLPFSFSMVRHLKDQEDKFHIIRPVMDVLKLATIHAILVVIALSMQSALTFV